MVAKKKVVDKKPMHVSVVLDETASMAVIKKETICAFNEYVDSLKLSKYPTSLTLTKFNTDKTHVVYTDKSVKDVPKLSIETYVPTACTNLYDAVGKTINALELKNTSKDKSVLVVIITDGAENSSIEFSQQKVFELIKAKKEKGWTFVFMGADQDAWLASSVLGITKGNTMSFKGTNVKGAMQSLSNSTTFYASSSIRNSGASASNFFSGSSTTSKGKKR